MFAAVPIAEPEVGWEGGGVGLRGVAVWKNPHESWVRMETRTVSEVQRPSRKWMQN